MNNLQRICLNFFKTPTSIVIIFTLTAHINVSEVQVINATSAKRVEEEKNVAIEDKRERLVQPMLKVGWRQYYMSSPAEPAKVYLRPKRRRIH